MSKDYKRTTIMLKKDIYDKFDKYVKEQGFSSTLKFARYLILEELRKNKVIDMNDKDIYINS